MGQFESPARDQLALEPVFRRVAQATTSRPVDTDGLVNQTDGPVSQHVSIPTGQSVDSLTANDAGEQKEPVKQKSRLIIAVDFGTTYSTVSYAKINPGTDSRTLATSQIHCINNYTNACGYLEPRDSRRADNVPTKLLYFGPKAPNPEPSANDSDSDDNRTGNMHFQPISAPDQSDKRRRKRGRKSSVSDSRRRTKTICSRLTGVAVDWGFDVQFAQGSPERMLRYPEKEIVELIKLTLGEESKDEDLQRKRAELKKQIERLQSRGIIEDRDHLLRDYLTFLLEHAKKMLEEEGLLEAAQLEYVLCVPVSWSEHACRTMNDAMVKAIQASKLGVLQQGLIPDLFIVSEPEAAAQYVMATLNSEGKLTQGEVFVILDAGGGTVDITTYEVTSDELGPLRLQGEVIAPDGALCGSGLITERYLRKYRAKLDEIDPTGNPDLLNGKAIKRANQWDMLDKRSIDVASKDTMYLSSQKRYHNGRAIKWTEDEIRDIFEPSLKGTTDLLERQLQLATEKGLTVNKVIVVGGFGESPSLRPRIEQVLSTYRNRIGEGITAIWPTAFPTSTVARGAVLRALDKANGPSRISRSSFGFLRHEPHGAFDEHNEAEVEPERDNIDNDQFVYNTIYWVIQAGDEVLSPYQTEPVLSCHTFQPWVTELKCIEKLYVSQREHRSHFQCHHKENKGASELSFIEIDVSELKKEFPLEEKADMGPRTKMSNRFVRVVKFDLVIEVEGKQLKYEARWPPGAKTPEEVRVRKSGYVSLAPSFAPGTV